MSDYPKKGPSIAGCINKYDCGAMCVAMARDSHDPKGIHDEIRRRVVAQWNRRADDRKTRPGSATADMKATISRETRNGGSLHPVVRRHRPWWIEERHNPQLGTYHVACGQMSKTAAKKHEDCKYGYNIMRPFDTEKEYTAHLEYLREKGERVQ